MSRNSTHFLCIMTLMMLMLSTSSVSAESYFRYIVTDSCSHWENGELVPTMDFEWDIYCYDETVTTDGKTYVMLHCGPAQYPASARLDDTASGDDGLRHYTLGVREADGKVYANYAEYMDHLSRTGFSELEEGFLGNPDYVPYHLTGDGEIILYDYTMEVGDQYRHVDGYNDVSVVDKDLVTLSDGKEHRRLTLNNGLVLVEGLGCVNSTGLMLDYLNPAKNENRVCAVLGKAITDGKVIYEIGSIPPVDSIAPVIDLFGSSHQVVYDLQGRRLSGQPARGIYVTHGRKRVVR